MRVSWGMGVSQTLRQTEDIPSKVCVAPTAKEYQAKISMANLFECNLTQISCHVLRDTSFKPISYALLPAQTCYARP